MEWFKDRYYYDGANARYETFHKALSLLKERHKNPIIIETGCQRQKEDLGAGMSTSIFAEFISKYGGTLHVVDNTKAHLDIAFKCVANWVKSSDMYFYCNDSVKFLSEYKGSCNLLYLDSYDYPIGQMWDKYGGRQDLPNAMEVVKNIPPEELIVEFGNIIIPCQEHCLNEFKAMENKLLDSTIVLVDDNDFPGGGKPGLLKPYLKDKGWKCLIDSQQTLWTKE